MAALVFLGHRHSHHRHIDPGALTVPEAAHDLPLDHVLSQRPLRSVVGGLAGWVAGLVRGLGGLRWAGLFGKTGVCENGENAERFTLVSGPWVACSGSHRN